MSNSQPLHCIPVCVADTYTTPPPPEIMAVHFYLVACPPIPLAMGMDVHLHSALEPYTPAVLRPGVGTEPECFATQIWGRLVGVRLAPGHRAVFDMETWNTETQIRMAYLHLDVYPGVTMEGCLWVSLAVELFQRRLLEVTRYCGWEGYEYRPQNLLEDALKYDPISEEIEEKWDDTYQVWWDGTPRPAPQDGGMDVIFLEPLLPPGTSASGR